MEQKIHFKYFNPQLNIGMFDLKNLYLLNPELMKLIPEVYKAKLVFRIPGSSKRISYSKIEKGLFKNPFFIVETIQFKTAHFGTNLN